MRQWPAHASEERFIHDSEAPASEWQNEILPHREAFLKLRKRWTAAHQAGPDPSEVLTHDFLRLWLDAFNPSPTLWTVLSTEGSRIGAALGLAMSEGRVSGVKLRLAQSWTNSHSTRGGVLLGSRGLDALSELLNTLDDLPFDALLLRDVPQEGEIFDTLVQNFRKQGYLLGQDRPMDSPYIPLPSSAAELSTRLDRRFRQNLRRRRRRLSEQGELGFEVLRGEHQAELGPALADAFAIEASGWKGRSGTAINALPQLVAFYSAWARQLAKTGALRLCFLRLNGERIAFHFGYVSQNRYWLPKCGFNPAYRECSPGQLLMEDVLGLCIGEDLEAFEFLGHSMPWKRDWTPLVHPHLSLWAFRPTLRGKLAHAIRFGLLPWGKSWARTGLQQAQSMGAKAQAMGSRIPSRFLWSQESEKKKGEGR